MKIYLGTWQIAPSDGFWADQNRPDSEAMLSYAVRMGIGSFDTAQSYGKGQAEQTLAKVLSRFPSRSFTVDTKIMPSTRSVSDIVKTSTGRLRGLGIDCLYLHWPRSGFDNIAFLREMEGLRDGGVVRRLGVCNMGISDLEAVLDAGIRIDRLQRPLSLLWSRDWKKTVSFCHSHKIEVATYSPMGMGLLSGKYREKISLEDRRKELFCFDERCHSKYLELLDTLEKTAGQMGLSTADVALAWTVSKKPDMLLLGARNAGQLENNLKALDVRLSESGILALDDAAKELDNASRAVCENIFGYNW